jgi:alginate O-acetyltransferase complex protein AlgI
MLFNSYTYIFLFLPASLIVYFILNGRRRTFGAKVWLLLASLVFYGWWNPVYTPLILGSIAFNYAMGTLISRYRERGRRKLCTSLLAVGLAGNLVLLGYFKYTDFFIANLNALTHSTVPLLGIVLPLGISFFTFTQIAYLVDTKTGRAKEYGAVNYGLFVTFFPHLLAGPIIHHREIMPQFDRLKNKVVDYRNVAEGLYLFFLGLFKKVVIADTFAIWANYGFDTAGQLTLVQAWAASLCYTLQLYYDFSGYTDIALGSSLMFNVRLPINFNSPYRSLDIQEFWRRWHITLGRFMRDYIYIPLGGSKLSEVRTLLNVMITFFLVGLWHGAGWTFVFWGLLHGTAMVVHRIWQKLGLAMPRWLAWFLTFNFINMAWVFFRARNFDDALKVLKGMAGMSGISAVQRSGIALTQAKGGIPIIDALFEGTGSNGTLVLGMLLLFFPLSFIFRNSNELAAGFKPSTVQLIFLSLIAFVSVLFLGSYSEFLYFRF